MKKIKQLGIYTLTAHVSRTLRSISKAYYSLGLCLLICGFSTIYGEAYRIQLAKIQPHFDKVTIEYWESSNNSVKVTYNETNTQSTYVEKANTLKEHMHPIQALVLGCQELNLNIFNYSLDVIKQNNMQLNVPVVINKLMTMKAGYEKNNSYLLSACLAGVCFATFVLSENEVLKFVSGLSLTSCIAGRIIDAWYQKKSLKKIHEMLEALARYQEQS